jgi:hypothetical protein
MLRFGSFVFAMAAATGCCAQEITQTVADAASTAPPSITTAPNPAPSACCHVSNGTLLTLEILETLDSSLLKRGDRFRIRLAEPLVIDGHALLAAGTEGIGEVVHAEKSRGGGKAGELLIAARYLDHQGTQVPLRGLKMGGAGKDKTAAALALSFAAGPFALFLQGEEIVIPAGSLAEAKVAQDMDMTPLQTGGDAPASTDVALAPLADPHPASTSDAAVALPEAPATEALPPSPEPAAETPAANDVQPIQQPKE